MNLSKIEKTAVEGVELLHCRRWIVPYDRHREGAEGGDGYPSPTPEKRYYFSQVSYPLPEAEVAMLAEGTSPFFHGHFLVA